MNFIPFSILTTNRLILRKATKADGNEIIFSRFDQIINKSINRSFTDNLKETEKFINKIEDRIPKRQNINWNITLKSNLKMIGTICLWNFSEDQKTVEVGYDLYPQFQGMGIMSEALKCVVDYGFKKLELEKKGIETIAGDLLDSNFLKRIIYFFNAKVHRERSHTCHIRHSIGNLPR